MMRLLLLSRLRPYPVLPKARLFQANHPMAQDLHSSVTREQDLRFARATVCRPEALFSEYVAPPHSLAMTWEIHDRQRRVVLARFARATSVCKTPVFQKTSPRHWVLVETGRCTHSHRGTGERVRVLSTLRTLHPMPLLTAHFDVPFVLLAYLLSYRQINSRVYNYLPRHLSLTF